MGKKNKKSVAQAGQAEKPEKVEKKVEKEEEEVEDMEDMEDMDDMDDMDGEDFDDLDMPEPGFWGLEIEPKKTYSQVVDAAFHLTMAALDAELPKGASRTSICVTIEDKKFTLCNLIPNNCEQVALNHIFREGEEITFSLVGNCKVHLTGYYMPIDEHDDDDFDDDYEDDGEDDDDDFDDEDDDDEEGPKITELDDEAPALVEPKRKAQEKELPPTKKQAVEGQNQKPQPAKQEKQEKKEQPKQQPKEEKSQKPQEAQKGAKKTLANGLVIEDLKVGDGKQAKKGNTVHVRYTGKLANGSVFDSNTSGEPFKFVLGKSEVIKGWDLGLEGMAIGGERKLIIPPALAYGKQGQPPVIPKNAQLTFVVKLLGLN